MSLCHVDLGSCKIGIARGLDIGMAKRYSNIFEVIAISQTQGGIGVADGMRGEAGRKSGRAPQAAQQALDALPVQAKTGGGEE